MDGEHLTTCTMPTRLYRAVLAAMHAMPERQTEDTREACKRIYMALAPAAPETAEARR